MFNLRGSLLPVVPACLVAALVPLAAARAADQPQWGAAFSRNMVSAETNLPNSFDPATGRNLKWKAEMGTETYSTPVVAGGRVFIGTNNSRPRDPRHEGDRSVLLCLDERSGSLLWQLVVPKLTNSPYWDWPNAGICSPATVEKDRAYLVSNRGELLCLDVRGMADGNQGPFLDEARHCVPAGADPVAPGPRDADILWAFDILKECGVRQHDQAHGSVLVDGEFLYVNTSNGVDDSHRRIDAPEAPSLVVVEKRSGRLVATDGERIGPKIFHCTWSSPMLAEVAGRRMIVFCGGDGIVYAFEPLSQAPPAGQVLTLKKIWQFDCDPAAPKSDIHRFLSDRKTGPSNIKSMPVFCEGRIYVTSGGDVWWGRNEARLQCINPTGTGDITASGLVWTYPLDRHCMSTPAVHNGRVYVADCGRKIHCVDAKAGRALWVQDAGGDLWGSPLVADGKVYVGTRRNALWVLADSPDLKVLSTVELDSPIPGSPVAANGALYVASMKFLYAVQAGQGASSLDSGNRLSGTDPEGHGLAAQRGP